VSEEEDDRTPIEAVGVGHPACAAHELTIARTVLGLLAAQHYVRTPGWLGRAMAVRARVDRGNTYGRSSGSHSRQEERSRSRSWWCRSRVRRKPRPVDPSPDTAAGRPW
jgi:hypothetical protein